MAKVKQIKSMQERLEEAIVPKEQAPFAIPENWCWVNLKLIVKHQAGNSKLIKGKLSSSYCMGLYKAYSASGQDVFYKDYEHAGEAIIVSAVGARCGKAFFADGKWSAIANTHIIYPNGLNGRFLFYILNNEDWWVKSGSAQPFVVVNESLERPFKLPPLEEQKRIVDKIESLFARLDEAKELIQKSLDEFEDRKSAILHKAFNGELTEKWRSINGKKKNYSIKKFREVAEIQCNLVDPNEFPDMPHIAPDNIEKFTGKLLDYHSVKEDKVISGKHRFYSGQILYSKIRPNLCKLIVADFDGLCSADMYPIRAKENTRYLFYFMLSNQFLEQATTAGSRSVLPKINQKELSNLNVVLPSIDEQKEIVRILDNFFEKEDKSKELLDMIDQIEEMKKSILARAFRGELGTHSDDDEPAIELLRKILK